MEWGADGNRHPALGIEMDEDGSLYMNDEDDALSDHWSDMDDDRLFEEDDYEEDERAVSPMSASAAAAALAGGLGLGLPFGLHVGSQQVMMHRSIPVCLTPRGRAAAEAVSLMSEDPLWQQEEEEEGADQETEVKSEPGTCR